MNTKKIIGEERSFKRRDGGEVSVLFYPSRKPDSPLLVDIHGGGFVSGHHYSDDRLCSFLNNKLDINVASIEYRYAPKVSYPESTYDCLDAVQGLIDDSEMDFNRSRVFLMGHSAGANIAAGISILIGKSLNIRGQILNYPFLDAYIDPKTRPHHRYSIPSFNMKLLNMKYYPEKGSRKDPLASPVYMTAEQAGSIPDSIVISCSMDSLRQDADRYVSVLKEAGVFVEHIEYEEAVHGFIEMVAAEKINRVWWVGKTLINRQKDLYTNAIDRICDFITERL